LKRTLLLSMLAMIPAVLLPLATTGQVSPDRGSRSTDESEQPVYKWEVYAGYGYTSLNQVNQSRSGLQGGNVSITRDWGKYFGVTGDGAYYSYPFDNPVVANSTLKPSVDLVLFGPVAHVEIWGKVSGFARGFLGGEHTGGESQTPNISLAGGFGGGLEYRLTQRISLRASGDDIASSFSLTGNSPALGYSPHKHWNSRAGFGAVYRF
jgi:hypothetical protein